MLLGCLTSKDFMGLCVSIPFLTRCSSCVKLISASQPKPFSRTKSPVRTSSLISLTSFPCLRSQLLQVLIKLGQDFLNPCIDAREAQIQCAVKAGATVVATQMAAQVFSMSSSVRRSLHLLQRASSTRLCWRQSLRVESIGSRCRRRGHGRIMPAFP